MKKVLLLFLVCFLTFSCNNEIRLENPSVEAEVVGIRVAHAPEQMMYFVNERLDLSGLIVNAVYADESEKEIQGYTVSITNGTVLNKIGTTEIDITYKGFLCSLSIVVYDESQSYKEIYEKGFIGQTINLLTATDFIPDARFTPIFDLESLYRLKPSVNKMRSQEIETVVGTNIISFAEQIKSSFNKKLSKGVDLSVLSIPSMIDFGLSAKLDTNYESSYQTEEYYCRSTYLYEEEEIGLKGYYNIKSFTKYLTEEFKNDALAVGTGLMSPKEFVEKYGTNVLMSSIVGSSYNALYHVSTTDDIMKKEFDSNFKKNFEVSLFGLASSGNNSGLDLNYLCEKDTKNTNSGFRAYAVGGGVSDFSTGKGASEGFKQWINTITYDNTVVIDVPDESLYFVWDLLDDTYSDTKVILNEYFTSECESLNEKFINAAAKYQTKEIVKFDETTGILTIDLGYFYENNEWDKINYSFYENGVLTVMPKYNFVPVKKILIQGRYGKENSNGMVINAIIDGLSIKLSDQFRSNVEIEFENVGIIGAEGISAVDLSECDGISETILIFTGKNTISSKGNSITAVESASKKTVIKSGKNSRLVVTGAAGISSSPDGGNAIQANNLYIQGDIELSINGGKGLNGEAGADGYRQSMGQYGQKGGAGGHGIICNSLSIEAPLSDILISGGSGGSGGKSGESKLGGWKLWEKGVDGPDGGDGGSCIVARQKPSIEADITYSPGLGGNGGSAGSWGDQWAVGCYAGNNGSRGIDGKMILII